MIEASPEEYWVETSFENIQLYLFSLNIDGKVGWRIPTEDELFVYLEVETEWDILDNYWVTKDMLHDTEYWNTREFTIIPVRDLKDDNL